MQAVGAAWLLGDLDASSAVIAMVQTATFLPVFLVGIPAGALADVFDRRKLLLWTQAGMMLSAFALAALTFTDSIQPSGVLALTFALGTGSALMTPAWMAIQPDLVGKQHFGQAVALNSMTYNVARAVGPAIGGLVIAAAGTEWVFALNGVSFVGTMMVLAMWRPAQKVAGPSPSEKFSGAAVAGLRYGFHAPLVRIVLVRTAVLALPGAALQALLPIVVRGPLGWGSGGYGILLGCFGLGATISAVLRPRIVARVQPDRIMGVASVVVGTLLVVQGYSDNRLAIGVALLVGGFMWSLALTSTTIAAQAALPAWVRARGMALYSLVMTGSIAVGAAAAGFAANWNLRATHLIAAAAIILGQLTAFRWPLTWPHHPDLTMVPGDEPSVAMSPEPDDGPVLVTVRYRVLPSDIAEFGAIMDYLKRHRRRTGGFRWGLFRDLGQPDLFVETFLVSSWAEHLRQHHRKTAHSDEVMKRSKRFIDSGDHAIGHFISWSAEDGAGRDADQSTSDTFVDEVFTDEMLVDDM